MADVTDVAVEHKQIGGLGITNRLFLGSSFTLRKKEGRTMFWRLYKRGKGQGFWQPHQAIMVAVSDSIDSMALLTLMGQVTEREQLQLVIARINHQLREASAQRT